LLAGILLVSPSIKSGFAISLNDSVLPGSNNTGVNSTAITQYLAKPAQNISSFANTPSSIKINEVELNPGGNTSNSQWVELHNPGGKQVDLSHFNMRTIRNFTILFPPTAKINAGGFYVLKAPSGLISDIADRLVLQNATGMAIS